MTNSSPILSFLVVTYNHEQCVQRCLDSLLALPINIPYEIVVGDDRSSDNTYKILEKYQTKYPDIIQIYKVNSDDANPMTNGERAGYNRSCGYKLLRGKYYAEVDGDDYVLPNQVYQTMVEFLENHPDCHLCMQNFAVLKDGDDSNRIHRYHPQLPWNTGDSITAEEYLMHPEFFMQHQGFVFRRNMKDDPTLHTGRFYEDTTVSLFHLQYGNIGIVNESGYVWICYPNGINGGLRADDRTVILGLLPFLHIVLYPKFKDLILRGEYRSINGFVKWVLNNNSDLSEKNIEYLTSIPMPIYQSFATIGKLRLTGLLKLKFMIVRFILICTRKLHYNIHLLRLAYWLLNGNVKRSQIVK